MKPEDIVVSLEMAKKLKDAGWGSWGSLYGWVHYKHNGHPRPSWKLIYLDKKTKKGMYRATLEVKEARGRFLPAPTSEEILRRCGEYWKCSWSHGGPTCWVEHELGRSEYFRADTLANAAASLWLHLKEHNLLPPTAE